MELEEKLSEQREKNHENAENLSNELDSNKRELLTMSMQLSESDNLISELKPVLAEIIKQGISKKEIHFNHPDALAEIVLIVLSVKLDNTLIPSTYEEVEDTIFGLIELLEKGTQNPAGSLNFLRAL